MRKYIIIILFFPVFCYAQPQTQLLYTGEYTTPWVDSAGNARSLTSNLGLAGTGGTGTAGLPGLINTGGVKFNQVNNLLHGLIFVSIPDSGVWTAGGGDQGQTGQGGLSNVSQLTKIPSDSSGNTVHGITVVQGFYVNNTSEGFWAVKYNATTDTIFGTGDLEYGMSMNGTAGQIATRLWPLYWKTGKHIKKIAASKAYAILYTDGTVETGGANGLYLFLGYAGSGTQYRTPHAVAFPSGMTIVDIVGGDVGGFMCLGTDGHLYWFGPHSGYAGETVDGSYATPLDVNTNVTSYILNGTTRTSITAISANSDAFHYIANDSTQWGNGDNGQGSVGNGVEVNMPTYTTPWSIDPAQILVLPQVHPVQITKKHNFIKIFSGCLFGFAHFSLDANGQIYANGRNKGAVCGNGVIECAGANGDISATYANSWDLPYCTPVTPYSLGSNILASCPGCKTGVVTTYCSECTIPTTTPTANGGGNKTITGNSVTLDGSGSTCTGGKITYYLWTQVSGAASTIDVPAAIKPNISGLTTGTYVYNLAITDNGFSTSNQNITVTVNPLNTITFPAGAKLIIH